jgi:hypothetical protein
MRTYAEDLILKLQDISSLVHELLDNSSIRHFRNDPNSELYFFAPSYYWGEPSHKEQQIQFKIRPCYNRWIESFKLITENLSEPQKQKLKETDIFINNWINKTGEDWGVPATVVEAKEKFDETIHAYYDTLEMLNSAGHRETLIIPDTNSIVSFPDPTAYRQVTETDTFTVVLVPTVLSELDELKIKANNPEFRNKIRSSIARIKGYRNQGSLLDGIKLHGTITLKMIATEPDLSRSLSWLMDNNNDDKIIASSLEVLRESPSSQLIIVTSDINLQNKCEMANIPYGELKE